jgi:hypothetical protein
MIDGDGSLPLVKGRSYKNTANGAKISLVATPVDIEAFQVFISKHLGVRAYTWTARNMSYITLTGNQAKFLVELLYGAGYSANLRKVANARRIINMRPTTRSNSWRPPIPRDEAEYSLNA